MQNIFKFMYKLFLLYHTIVILIRKKQRSGFLVRGTGQAALRGGITVDQ